MLFILTFKNVPDGRTPGSLGGWTVHLHLFHVDMLIMGTDALYKIINIACALQEILSCC